MVYHSFARLLQTHCLLCQCRCSSLANNSGVFGLCRHCLAALPLIEHGCEQCGIHLPVSHARCGQCLAAPPSFSRTYCALGYEHNIPALIHQFKKRHSKAMTHLLCDLLLQQLPATPAVHCIMPAPMHWQRNLQRGNNHALLLAKQLSTTLNIPLDQRSLQRPVMARAQKQLTAEQRKRNLQQAFQCTGNVSGMRIALVDDVMTTGSTMEAMALTLRNAGAIEVQCWVIARTPKH